MKTSICLILCLLNGLSSASIQITDSNGILTFEQVPQRVVVINWTLADQVMSLGIEPVGIADLGAFQRQAPEINVPPTVADVGARSAPDLNMIKRLNPDVIILGYSQKRLSRVLSNIAPVVYFKNFSRRYNNAEKADERFLELAKLFGLSHAAKNQLLARDASIQQMAQKLQAQFGGDLPEINLMVIESDQEAFAFGPNSMPYYAWQRLGLTTQIEQKPSQLGVRKMGFKRLQSLSGCVLYISPETYDPIAADTWPRSKAAEKGCFIPLPRVFLYGGAMSLERLASQLTASLISHHSTAGPDSQSH